MQPSTLETLWLDDRIDPTDRVHVSVVERQSSRAHTGDLLAEVSVHIPGEVAPRIGLFLVELKDRAEPSTLRSFLDGLQSSSHHPILVSSFTIGARAAELLTK